MAAVIPLREPLQTNLSLAFKEFLADLRLRGLSPHTIQWYTYSLRPFLRCADGDPEAVDEQTVRRFLTERSAHVRPHRVNHYLEAVDRFYRWLIAQGYAMDNPAAEIGKMREPKKLIHSFTEAEVIALLRQPDTRTFIGLRDYVFMLLLLDTGLRLSEALGLTMDDIDTQEQTLKVMGKGSKERRVGFSDAFLRELVPYLARREAVLRRARHSRSPWLFPNQIAGKMTPRGIRLQLATYGKRAGITRVRVSPHTFRHTFALWFVRKGGSPFHLQKILGHSSLDMSRRYCELAEIDAIIKQHDLSPLQTMDLGLRGRRRLR